MDKRIMFWSDESKPNPFSITSDIPISSILEVVDFLRNPQGETAYKGWANCRICGETLGTKDFHRNGYTWPEMAEHYILKHYHWDESLTELMKDIVYS